MLENDSTFEISKRKTLHITESTRERAILVGVARPPSIKKWTTDEHLEELESLAETAGVEVIEKIYQQRSRIDPALFIGKGKAEYLAQRIDESNIQLIIFDDDLSAVQVRNLEKIIQRKIIDRTGLILDIFASRAVTKEAQTQVELAQLEYLLPRLTRQWTHLSKQYGGIGTKGPGETQIETDRRLIRTRISYLKQKLEKINLQRNIQRKGRIGTIRVALVGYTNVGKSTLLNLLSGADVLVENKLFATLDSTVREIELSKNVKILLSDTVGFIRKLPTLLIASFKSTLAEVVEADILLHVVDITHPHFAEQIEVVNSTLADIHAAGKPTIMVFNKIDALKERGSMQRLQEIYPNHIFISALRGINIQNILSTLLQMIEESTVERVFQINPIDYKIEAEFHKLTEVSHVKYEDEQINIACKASDSVLLQLTRKYPKNIFEITKNCGHERDTSRKNIE